MNKQTKVKKVTESDNGWDISTEDSSGFFFSNSWGVIPVVGDLITVQIVQGSTIRGVILNGKQIFYKTDEDLDREHKEWCEKYEKEKQERFEKEKSQLDIDYVNLPVVFKQRIDKFRNSNPRFRVDYESYEMFCCKEAIKIANGLIELRISVKEFQDMSWDEQKENVPDLDEGHSGNAFGMSCRLAHWYMTETENLVLEHGALTPLVGCKDYGCSHSK